MPERVLVSSQPVMNRDEVTVTVLEHPSRYVQGLSNDDLDFLARRVLDELANRGITRFNDVNTDWRSQRRRVDAFRVASERYVRDMNRQSWADGIAREPSYLRVELDEAVDYQPPPNPTTEDTDDLPF